MEIDRIKEKMKDRKVGAVGRRRYFSVLILLIERKDGIHILYERRSRKMKAQPGDVCFPGGRMEEGETPLQCALRETREEIGIPCEKIEVLGQFDTLYEIAGITLYTFVGVIGEETLACVQCNEAEVEEVFTAPFSFFSDKEPMVYESKIIQKVEDFPYEETGIRPDYKWRTGQNIIPIYQYKDYVIWGITGRITKWFVEKMNQ